MVEDPFLKHENILNDKMVWTPGQPLKVESVSTVTKGLLSILLFLPKASGHTTLTASQCTHTDL